MKKWLVLAAVAVVAYIAWRKFGGTVQSAVSSVTA